MPVTLFYKKSYKKNPETPSYETIRFKMALNTATSFSVFGAYKPLQKLLGIVYNKDINIPNCINIL